MSNLGLRRLLLPDILELKVDDTIIIVLSSTSPLLPLYKGGILSDIRDNNRSILQRLRLQLASNTLEQRHEVQRLGTSHYEFRAVIVSYPKRPLLYYDTIDPATLRLWMSQGEGFSIELLDYPGQTVLIKWKDLQDVRNLEIWKLATRKDLLHPVTFGQPRSMESKSYDLDNALNSEEIEEEEFREVFRRECFRNHGYWDGNVVVVVVATSCKGRRERESG
jgi:hypothetical protein